MAKILLLNNYNNYFNRIIKGYSALSDYSTEVGTGNFYLLTAINFNPNDNVSAELIINDCPFDADYLVVADDTTSAIESRWFILEAKRTRKGQYDLTLRRDVIYDYQAELFDSPVYIQKAVLPDTDPFILNSEGMSFNEIKTEETLLRDKTGCSWIILYTAKNASPANITVDSQPDEINATSLSAIATAAGMTEVQLASVMNFTPYTTPAFFTTSVELRFGIENKYAITAPPLLERARLFFGGDFSKQSHSRNNVLSWTAPLYGFITQPSSVINGVLDDLQDAVYNNRTNIIAQMPTITNRSYYFTSEQLKILKKYEGRYILYSGKYYVFRIEESSTQNDPAVGPNVYTTYSSISTAVVNAGHDANRNANGQISIWTKSLKVYLNAEEISSSGDEFAAATVAFSATRNVLLDENFDIVAIPYGPYKINGVTVRGSLAKRVAQAMAFQLTSSVVYDVQLLPYCPLPNLVDPLTGSISLDVSKEHYLFDYIDLGGGLVDGVIFYPTSNSFSIQLDYTLSLKNSMKVEACCNKYRLCSPNYQGSFDFNVAKNGGSVDYFIAECTYKPYTPYIKIAPNFKRLYGAAFGDNRGLICGGDYSFGIISSEWEQYKLNNKNYQNIFNRDIQNLDFEQSLEMRQQIIGAGVGVLTAGAAGAGAGSFVGGGYGALAGGIIGAGASALGGMIDTDILSKRHREAKSISIDKYNYQLGNIKALPYTLTKICAFDINSKIWPFLEYYTCTDEEKEALENKIAYESMTVMRIGLFGTYFKAFNTPRYFKGELIRCEALAEDSHVLEAVYEELLKGVFM